MMMKTDFIFGCRKFFIHLLNCVNVMIFEMKILDYQRHKAVCI